MESCRDCANLEDRREIEGVAICAMHHGPAVSCPEFKSRKPKTNLPKLYNRFCVKCANFEDVNGVPVCSKDHRPGAACGSFAIKEKSNKKKEVQPDTICIIG